MTLGPVTKVGRVLWLTFCEVDERYIDLFRVGYALVLLTGIGLAIYSVANGGDFDAMAFGGGLGAILFGGGLGAGLRGRFEDGQAGYGPTNNPWTQAEPWQHGQRPWDRANIGAGGSNPWYTPDEEPGQPLDPDGNPPSRYEDET